MWPAGKLSYSGEQSEPRERGSFSLARPSFTSPLACLSGVYFSRYPPNGELARRLRTVKNAIVKAVIELQSYVFFKSAVTPLSVVVWFFHTRLLL